MTQEILLLSRQRLETFLICRRRFQLRYLRRLPWPDAPLDEGTATAVSRGEQFHQLVQRHFLGLPVSEAAIEDTQLRRWWRLFAGQPPLLPPGQRHVERSLTVPVQLNGAPPALLSARFDLLVTGKNENGPSAHVFDWKTGRLRSAAELTADWQTRLYLALLAAGGAALWGNGRSVQLAPENVTITYWSVQQPDAPHTIRYDAAAHAANWAEITAVIAAIHAEAERDAWPLTDDWSHCRVCAYQAYCGRQEAGQAGRLVDADAPPETAVTHLEPDLP